MAVHKRPMAVIFRDDAAGHRSPISGRVVGDPQGWTEWDYALVYAVQVIEDFTDQFGLLSWEVEDEAVEVDAVKKIHKFAAARDRATSGTQKKPYKPEPGEMFYPRLWSRRSDGYIQTFSEWASNTEED